MSKGGRPRKIPKESTAVQLLVPDDVLAKYDAWVQELHDTVPGGEGISRADLMRDVLSKAVETRMARSAKKRPAARPGG